MAPRPAVFLDRDGVVIEDGHYVGSVDRVRLVPGSAPAVAALNRAGWVVVVVTNQAGVAKGYFTDESVPVVHAHIGELLAEHGGRVDAFYHCPHHPDGEVAAYRLACDCRKPKPGMLRRAAAELDLDLGRSWMVGDRVSDLEAGAAVGAKTVLVRTGYGAEVDAGTLDRSALNLAGVVENLAAAVQRFELGRGPHRRDAGATSRTG
ncbi:MAG: D-glycero-beta-D-manno-heptose 1,7-bisphosphate 7-phosphatase [Gemmataceae bacterium]|nr:D-glycero-beta-D-manno-heptose 1,7-bisphosphate 7-phosphatase [Gemmataceae bacterium]